MLMQTLLADETGFIVSAELLLVSTLLVIGMIVGLSEVQHAVTQELNDVGDAFGNLNQSFFFSGFSARKDFGIGIKSFTNGSVFVDTGDDCDFNQCTLSCYGSAPELPKQSGVNSGAINAASCAQIR